MKVVCTSIRMVDTNLFEYELSPDKDDKDKLPRVKNSYPWEIGGKTARQALKESE